jgi:predicted RNA binding protein YcfA (HicA-like mRNA interferase family)
VSKYRPMERAKLMQHLASSGCRRKREGRKHEIWVGPCGGWAGIPRHALIGRGVVSKICKQMGVQKP